MRKTSTAAVGLLTTIIIFSFGSLAAAQSETIEVNVRSRGVVTADRSVILGERGRLLFWSSGESSPQIEQTALGIAINTNLDHEGDA